MMIYSNTSQINPYYMAIGGCWSMPYFLFKWILLYDKKCLKKMREPDVDYWNNKKEEVKEKK